MVVTAPVNAVAAEVMVVAAPVIFTEPEVMVVTAPVRFVVAEVMVVTAPCRFVAAEVMVVTAPCRFVAAEVMVVTAPWRFVEAEVMVVLAPWRFVEAEVMVVVAELNERVTPDRVVVMPDMAMDVLGAKSGPDKRIDVADSSSIATAGPIDIVPTACIAMADADAKEIFPKAGLVVVRVMAPVSLFMTIVDGNPNAGKNCEVNMMAPVPVDVNVTFAPTPFALRLTEAPVPMSTPRVSMSIFPEPVDFNKIPPTKPVEARVITPIPVEVKLISPIPVDKTEKVDAPSILNLTVSRVGGVGPGMIGDDDVRVNFPVSSKMKFVSPPAV